ncbi:MAG: IPTL-CTERM sorting domain-containing protein [Thermodesulfobacteriota bacterium]
MKKQFFSMGLIFTLFFSSLSYGGVLLPIDEIENNLGTLWTDFDDNGLSDGSPLDTGVSCVNDTGYSLSDAESADGDSDAYDQAFIAAVAGKFLSGGNNEQLIQEQSGEKFSSGIINVDAFSGLDITYQLYFPDDIQCARLLLTLENTTDGTIMSSVQIANNFGSDSSTVVEETSSGDTVFNTSDLWVVTSDGGPSDPVNTTILFGPGSPLVTPSLVTLNVCDDSATDGAGVSYDISVPPFSTQSLMLIGCLGGITGTGNTVSGAIAGAQMFNLNTVFDDNPTLICDLTQSELDSIINFDGLNAVPCPVTASAPTLSEWGFIIFALFSGLIAAWFMRRKQGLGVSD